MESALDEILSLNMNINEEHESSVDGEYFSSSASGLERMSKADKKKKGEILRKKVLDLYQKSCI